MYFYQPCFKFFKKTFKALVFSSLLLSSVNISAQLPDLGAPDLALYDTQTEQKLGEAFIKSLNTEFSLSHDPDVIDYIRKIGHKVADNSGQNREFRFYVIDNPTINAFAGPNGVIGIHTGLIKAVKTEDELASVIAHEIAHITQQHLSRRYLYNTTSGNVTSVATLLAAILIGMVDPNAGMAALMGGQSLNIQNQLKNSRQHENEADFVGIKILYDSGFNAHAMADFFWRLAENNRNNANPLPEILRTHPMTENRLVQAQNRANSMIPMRPSKESESLSLMKLRLNTLHKLSGWMFAPINKDQSANESCYQLNLLQLEKTNQNTQHLECLLQASQNHLDVPLYNNLLMERLAQLAVSPQTPQPTKDTVRALTLEALKVARLQKELFPKDNAVNLHAATLLQNTQQTTQAIAWLKKLPAGNLYQDATKEKLAELYDKNNQSVLAYLHKAEAQMEIFNIKRAKHFIELAQTLSNQKNQVYKQQIEKFLTKYEDRFESLKQEKD